MPAKKQSSVSTEFVVVPVSVTAAGEPYDPTADPVFMAFVPIVEGAEPEDPTDFFEGSWEVDNTGLAPVYLARCLVGPEGGETALEDGAYLVYVKIQDTPEVPVFKAKGRLIIE